MAAEPPEPAAGGRSPGRPKTPEDEDGPAPSRAFRPGAPFPPFPAARKTRRAPLPVLPGRVAGGIREGESQRNPGGPAWGARVGGGRTPGTGLPPMGAGKKAGLPLLPVVVLRVVAPPSGAGKKGGVEPGGGPEAAVSRATPAGGERSLLPASAAGRTGGASRGRRTGDAEPGARTRRAGARRCSGRAGPGGRRAGFPTSGMAGPPGGAGGSRGAAGSSFRFRGSFGAGSPSVSGVRASGVRASGISRFRGSFRW